MKSNFSGLLFVLISSFSILNFSACRDRPDTVSCFPSTPVNVVLNLSLPAYFNLQNVGGWVYTNEQQAGTRGLIVVRTTSGFKVYDRNAPHLCPDADTTLNVESNIKVICPKDGAEWILLTGEPTKIATVPPKTYPYSYDSGANILSVYY